jgi:membrane protein required for beta-lactamase induction
MTLIGIIIALICEHMLSHVQRWREHAWYMTYARWVHARLPAPVLWNSVWGLLPLLLPLLILVGLLQVGFSDGIYVVFALPLAVLILLLCLGPRDIAEELNSYFEARARGDDESLQRIERDLCAGPGRLRERDAQGRLVRAVLLQAHERLFGVLLWFFVAGPFGAVLYRLAASLPRVLTALGAGERLHEAARRLHALLAWAPAHLVAALYGLAGSTDDALKAWRAVGTGDDDWQARTWRVLTEVGCGALQIEDDVSGQALAQDTDSALHGALALIQRTLVILLGLFALFTIGGWLS